MSGVARTPSTDRPHHPVHDHSISQRCDEECPRWEFVNERVSHTGECDGAEGCDGCSYA